MSRPASLARIALAYLVAFGAAWGTAAWLLPGHPLLVAGVANLVATVMVFVFSLAHRNSSTYDPYWSVAPIPLVLFFAAYPAPLRLDGRAILVVVFVVAWGVRLTLNWARAWPGMHHEDWRYVNLRHQAGALYWAVSFFGLHLMPTVVVFLGCLSVWAALAPGAAPLGPLDAIAAVLTGGAILLETVADLQLHRYLRRRTSHEEILAHGLWSWSRHPNYVGEILFWWGLCLFGYAATTAYPWIIVGPVAMTGLFVFISLPMIEARSRARRPGWAEHARRVPALIPWPPREQI